MLSFSCIPSNPSRKGKMKRRRRGIEEIWQREVGELPPRTFAHHMWASQDLVLRLDIHKKLDKHRGCVNTVSFNQDGDTLISGSDDRMIMLWNWDAGYIKLSFHSGHTDNVFQAKMMPYSDDRSVVTCAADGQVRHAIIKEGGRVEMTTLGKHRGRVHKLAIEPGSPNIFYSCGEDGLVQHFDLRTSQARQLFTCHSFHDNSHYVPIVRLYTIAVDPRSSNVFAIAGSDEYARLYDIRKCNLDGSTNHGHAMDSFCPQHLVGNDQVGITGLAFSNWSELLVSYNDEHIYLFSRDLGLGPDPVSASPLDVVARMGSDSILDSPSNLDADVKPKPQVYMGHQNFDTIKGVNFFGPSCEYVVSGSDCGRIFIWRKKDGELLRAMTADNYVVNCIERHPHAAILASSGIENNIKMWIPKATERASLPANVEQVDVTVDCPQLKYKRRKWLFSFPSEDVVMHVFSSLQLSSGSEYSSDDSTENVTLVGFTDSSDDILGSAIVTGFIHKPLLEIQKNCTYISRPINCTTCSAVHMVRLVLLPLALSTLLPLCFHERQSLIDID